MGKSQEERAKRLADALRQNLKRRKAQARGSPVAEPADKDEGVQEHADPHQRS